MLALLLPVEHWVAFIVGNVTSYVHKTCAAQATQEWYLSTLHAVEPAANNTPP